MAMKQVNGKGQNSTSRDAKNIKNVTLRSMTLPKCQCTAEQYHLLIFAVFDV